MSKNKRERNASATHIGLTEGESSAESLTKEKNSALGYLRNHLWIVGVIVLLSIGALGAGFKYLEEDAKRVRSLTVREGSLIDTINPFLSPPPPPPTPQLSKEYIYAGSRLLAVEDANANAAPPADLAIWRPSTGVWWVMGPGGTQQATQQWGEPCVPPGVCDVPVPGDYDGDGKTDFSVFRPTNSTWYIVNSSTGATGQFPFGSSGDKPAPADYDGDGKTDAAVFRPSNSTWYIGRSSDGGTTIAQFGLSTDTPAPADYDGDGRADIGVWRNSNATYYTVNSSNGNLSSPSLGASGDTPVPSDYDGDGKANYALRSGNNWIVLNASFTATTTTAWQLSSDLAVHNDYDGDGKTDIATWRPSNGTWYIRKSSDLSTRTEQWGMNGDIPVPALYRR